MTFDGVVSLSFFWPLGDFPSCMSIMTTQVLLRCYSGAAQVLLRCYSGAHKLGSSPEA